MSNKAVELLSYAGWYSGRRLNVEGVINKFEQKGFIVFPKAKSFIEEFGMLDIHVPYGNGISGSKFHTTNVDKIISGEVTSEIVKEYENWIEEKLVIVGSLSDGHMYLMISESGKMFTEIGYFGKSPEEFWDRILNGDIVTNWEAWDWEK